MKPRSGSDPKPPLWGPDENAVPPNPFFTARLFRLRDKRRDHLATAVLVAVIVLTRFLALPASIWEQDEAYFGCAVLDFDISEHHPHPPWFPLWIALGKAVHIVIEDPTLALRIVGLAASSWMIFPLVALFSLWLRRDLAISGAVLFLFVPGTIFLGCRAFSGPTATALFVCALAVWLRGDDDLRTAALGSCIAGLCLLTRPHLMASILAVLCYRVWISKSHIERLTVVGPLALVGLTGLAAVAIDAGGFGPLWLAVEEHGQYHFGALTGAELSFSDSWLARYFLTEGLATGWVILALLGVWGVFRQVPRSRSAAVTALLGIAPLVVTVHTVAYAGNVRYAIPIVALGSGFSILGIAMLLKKWAVPAVASICALTFLAVSPALGEYRHDRSPPLRALESTLDEAESRGAVIVADGTLAAFIEYERLSNGIPFTVLFDSQIGTETVPPPAWVTVAIFDAGRGGFVARAERTEEFRSRHRWLTRLSQGRFLYVTVASGAETRKMPGGDGLSRGQ